MKKYLPDFALGIVLAIIFPVTGLFGMFEVKLSNLTEHFIVSLLVSAIAIFVFNIWLRKIKADLHKHIFAGLTPLVLVELFIFYIANSLF